VTTEVYYFSGTGNSFAVAREIANRIGGELLSIPAARRKQRVQTNADRIGIVFPSYLAQLCGVPLIVERFIRCLDRVDGKYIFAVATCGGYESFNALPALKSLSKLAKANGGKIAAVHSVRLPMNTLDYSHIPVPINKDLERMFRKCQARVGAICQATLQGKKTRFGMAKSILNWVMTPLYLILKGAYLKELRRNAEEPDNSSLSFRELIPRIDKVINCDDRCDGCGTCSKVCPAENISMSEGRPVWLHRCEMCLACAEWCPKKAIHHWLRVDGRTYHHPDVNVSDMLKQARVSL
jgi:ferredoxin